ncbi:MAG: DUF427 domain-containing protein [Fuerstiella sp.]
MTINREIPGPGQESVWDYPRPPRLQDCTKHIEVVVNSVKIASSRRSRRVLETSHPPVYYIPQTDIRMQYLVETERQSWCEWKGTARYFDVCVENRLIPAAAWSYPEPTEAFEPIRDYIAFYPSRVDACFVDEERVRSQAGDFYGGWITNNIVGPFKGEPGTAGW